jgi:RimJ/RimL family protein N-acetyltransferase
MSIELVPFTAADLDRLPGWIRTPEEHLQWTARALPSPLTREVLERHLAAGDVLSGERLLFLAVLPEGGGPVGYLELGRIDPANRSLRISRVLLAPEARGRGLGVALMEAALAYAFERLGVHRVELGVFDVNRAAIACYERAGFRREGMRRDSFQAPGGPWSEVVMSVLAPEWAAREP